ncbi:MAG: hypothetical protein FJ265_19985, partial [Planctomycetes bacterium]|nr:hypothetical protein [Planctomycetota bacterium]
MEGDLRPFERRSIGLNQTCHEQDFAFGQRDIDPDLFAGSHGPDAVHCASAAARPDMQLPSSAQRHVVEPGQAALVVDGRSVDVPAAIGLFEQQVWIDRLAVGIAADGEHRAAARKDDAYGLGGVQFGPGHAAGDIRGSVRIDVDKARPARRSLARHGHMQLDVRQDHHAVR